LGPLVTAVREKIIAVSPAVSGSRMAALQSAGKARRRKAPRIVNLFGHPVRCWNSVENSFYLLYLELKSLQAKLTQAFIVSRKLPKKRRNATAPPGPQM